MKFSSRAASTWTNRKTPRMKPGFYGMPDEVVEMTYKPGASRPSFSLELRRRVVRIQFDGGFRDILLEEHQVYGEPKSWIRWVDLAMWPVIAFASGFVACTMLLVRACV